MTDEQVQMTLDIAYRVLADSTSSPDRLEWAHDAVSALDHGDMAAARRIGLLVDTDAQKAAK